MPLIPRKTPILMLSGVNDEVVPREHMQDLWGLVQHRGAGAPAGTGTNTTASESEEIPGMESIRSQMGMVDPLPSVKVAVEDVRTQSKFIEFENGTHST